MNDSELHQLADAVMRVIRPQLQRSEPLRQMVALIGRLLCDEAARAASGTAAQGPDEEGRTDDTVHEIASYASNAPEFATSVDIPQADPPQPEPFASSAPASTRLVPLRLGDAFVHVPLSGTTEELARAQQSALGWSPARHAETSATSLHRREPDLHLVERRCRLKAASCRLFIERRAGAAVPDIEHDTRRRMNEMIADAKSMANCFLWVYWRERTPPDDANLAQIAENYDAHADAVALMGKIDEGAGAATASDEEDAIYLLAEANSALRAALGDTWLAGNDHDQADVHMWLKHATSSRRIYISRHMTADDPADPGVAAGLRRRIGEFNVQIDARIRRASGIARSLSQIRYHAGRIIKCAEAETSEHWDKIAAAVALLATMNVPETDRRITEALGHRAAASDSAQSPAAGQVAAIIGRARLLAERTAKEENTSASVEPREWSQLVLDVRDRVRGQRMVIVGGEPNPAAISRFNAAFELADADWISLVEHGSASPMRTAIQRRDTALVLVIIKLTGHLYAAEARAAADAAGKPCVLLTAGYNPEQVARAILEQASDRLVSRARDC
ncbi:MAG: hypothetical protein SGJ11_04100 [Phycisphaerae bacterium]|nr:hypothetical protein [Phycisphaerae bacterium]